MHSSEITERINEIYEGVEKSCLGPIVVKDEIGKDVIRNLAWDAFKTILASCFNPIATNTMKFKMEEDAEHWKKGE